MAKLYPIDDTSSMGNENGNLGTLEGKEKAMEAIRIAAVITTRKEMDAAWKVFMDAKKSKSNLQEAKEAFTVRQIRFARIADYRERKYWEKEGR